MAGDATIDRIMAETATTFGMTADMLRRDGRSLGSQSLVRKIAMHIAARRSGAPAGTIGRAFDTSRWTVRVADLDIARRCQTSTLLTEAIRRIEARLDARGVIRCCDCAAAPHKVSPE